jgi:hypothetical protein
MHSTPMHGTPMNDGTGQRPAGAFPLSFLTPRLHVLAFALRARRNLPAGAEDDQDAWDPNASFVPDQPPESATPMNAYSYSGDSTPSSEYGNNTPGGHDRSFNPSTPTAPMSPYDSSNHMSNASGSVAGSNVAEGYGEDDSQRFFPGMHVHVDGNMDPGAVAVVRLFATVALVQATTRAEPLLTTYTLAPPPRALLHRLRLCSKTRASAIASLARHSTPKLANAAAVIHRLSRCAGSERWSRRSTTT